jgi:RNA polymerase sigma-B factor
MVVIFGRRHEEREDIEQVVNLAVLKALDRFDPAQGVSFSTFAWATAHGEVRRYHRDHAWKVRVPRSLQEHYLSVAAATDELTHRLRRSPTITELAEATGLADDEVLEAIEVRRAYNVASLDAPVGDDDRGGGPTPAVVDGDLALADDRCTLQALVRRLPPRERRIVLLRFFGGLTQSEIAEDVGLSQMHVSRLLAQSLEFLRTHAVEGP